MHDQEVQRTSDSLRQNPEVTSHPTCIGTGGDMGFICDEALSAAETLPRSEHRSCTRSERETTQAGHQSNPYSKACTYGSRGLRRDTEGCRTGERDATRGLDGEGTTGDSSRSAAENREGGTLDLDRCAMIGQVVVWNPSLFRICFR